MVSGSGATVSSVGSVVACARSLYALYLTSQALVGTLVYLNSIHLG